MAVEEPASNENSSDPKAQKSVSSNSTSAQRKVPRSSRSRRSATDAIVAPGFGTRRDLERLARELSSSTGGSTSNSNSNTNSLPVAAVEAMMTSRGRGIRSSSRGRPEQQPPGGAAASAGTNTNDSNNAADAATPVSSAWADFMKEEGVAAAAAAETTATTGKRSHRGKGKNDIAAAAASMDTTADGAAAAAPRVYQLPSGAVPNPKKPRSEIAAGVLVQAGTLDATVVGRSGKGRELDFAAAHCLTVPTVILPPRIQIAAVFAAGHACHSVAVTVTGRAYGWGRNEAHQLGAALPANVYAPALLKILEEDDGDDDNSSCAAVRQAALGKSHTVFLLGDGRVAAVGANKAGQCGVKSSVDTVRRAKLGAFAGDLEPDEIVQISCGEDFSVAVDSDGYMYTTGSSEFGQLGNGETGECIIAANKIAFSNCSAWTRRTTFCHAPGEKLHGGGDASTKVVPLGEDVRIRQVACGKHHALALEAATEDARQPPRVWSWGCGDYGVLGHGVQADEYLPRLVGSLAQLRGPAQGPSRLAVAAGQHCSLLQTPNGHVYYWGKHRSVGEATMRPSLVDALANNQHVVTHAAAGGQTVVCCTANAQTVAWGQGPHGELGLGLQRKSSAKPTFVDGINGCRVAALACGYGHTLFVVRDDDKEDKAAVKKLPVLDPDAVQELADQAEEAPAPPPAKAGRKKK